MGASDLLARLELLEDDIRRTRRLLGEDTVTRWLGKAVRREPMERAYADFLSELDAAQGRLDQDRLDLAQGVPLQTCWRAFDGHRRSAEALFRESLAFLEGVVVRSQGVGDDFCAVADGMLAELSNASGVVWRRFTMLADGESYSPLAEVIRVRFPAGRIWDLPVAAHEFGHFASRRLTADGYAEQSLPFDELRSERVARVEQAGDHWSPTHEADLQEYYADAFAAYALGPAYACTCLRLRFNPTEDRERRDTMHPPDGLRARLIVEVLRLMDKQAKRDAGGVGVGYGGLLTALQDAWAAGVSDALGAAPADTSQEIVELARGLFRALGRRKELRFERWPQAQSLSARLGTNAPLSEVATRDSTLVDVVNAAWLKRLATPSPDLEQINAEAMALALRMVSLRA